MTPTRTVLGVAVLAAVAGLAISSCAETGTPDEPNVEEIAPSALESLAVDETLAIDLRVEDRAYLIPRELTTTQREHVMLVLPNGEEMGLPDYLDAVDAVDLSHREVVIVPTGWDDFEGLLDWLGAQWTDNEDDCFVRCGPNRWSGQACFPSCDELADDTPPINVPNTEGDPHGPDPTPNDESGSNDTPSAGPENTTPVPSGL